MRAEKSFSGVLALRLYLLLSSLLALGACAPTMTAGGPASAQGGSEIAPAPSASEQPAPVVVGWVYPLFAPSEASRKEACDAGYAAGLAGSKEPNPGEAEVVGANGNVSFQSSWGSTYNVCKSYAKKTLAKPEVLPLEDILLYITDSRLVSYHNPERFFEGISMVFYDAQGKELGRLQAALDIYGQRGFLSIPRSEDGRPWVYDGYFILSTNYNALPGNLKAAITRADSFDVLVSRGKGVERYAFNKAKFPNLR